jgi:hypothetical protein
VTIAELRLVLGHLQQLYVSAGANGPAKDLKTFSDALQAHAGKPVDLFVAEVRARLGQAEAKPKARKKAAAESAPRNEDAIGDHVAQLRGAGTDRPMFDQALDRLKADKSLKLPELAEIARQYSDSVTRYKSISAAQNDISKAFVRQARFENKLR